MSPISATGRRPLAPHRTESTGEAPRPEVQPVVIYTREGCGWCDKAKALLRARGISFNEVDVGRDAAARAKLGERLTPEGGRLTVPQIFFGDDHLGGYRELAEADARGALPASTLP